MAFSNPVLLQEKTKEKKKNEIHILGMCTDAYTMMILYKGESFES